MDTPVSVLVVGLNFAPETTGIAPYTAGLARELARRGWEVRALTSFPHYPEWRFREGSLPRVRVASEDGVHVERRRHRLPSRPGGLGRAWSEVTFGSAAVRGRLGRPDVVVLVSPALLSSAMVLIKVRLIRRVPVVVWVQDLYSLGLRELGSETPGLATRFIAKLEGWCLRRANNVVVIHERFRDSVVSELGVKMSNVTVVRNWSHSDGRKSSDRAVTRRNLGWGDDEFIVLHAGNMGVKQGLENVVEAARRAEAEGSKIRFVLLGDGNQRRMLEALAAPVANLTILDPQADEQFWDTLSAADALLVNERAGVAGMAVPSKLTSYFSTGLPVIAATDRGSVTESEVLLAGAGPVVQAGDPSALLAAAEGLAADVTGAKLMGQSALRFRAARLTPRASFDIFEALIRRLAVRRTATTTRESGPV